LKFYSKILKAMGYNVEPAASGKELPALC